MKRDKNLKITPQTHKLLKDYCEKNGLKIGFIAYVDKYTNPKTENVSNLLINYLKRESHLGYLSAVHSNY